MKIIDNIGTIVARVFYRGTAEDVDTLDKDYKMDKMEYESLDLRITLAIAARRGFEPTLIQQTFYSGSDGHIELKNPNYPGIARITSEEHQGRIMYKLYTPVADEHGTPLLPTQSSQA